MKSLSIYSVTYRSYHELSLFLQSVNEAARLVHDVLDVTVYVIDNTEDDVQPIPTGFPHIKVISYHTGNNLGYLGGVQACMEQYPPFEFSFSAITNVDLEVSPDAFCHLLEHSDLDEVGQIAPCTYSKQEHRDKNPQLVSRYSKLKLQLLYLLYRFPWLNEIYERTLYKRKSLASGYQNGKLIYAGHGSFMIFTREFFRRIGIPQYPVFLFGEEIYLAEMCRQNGLSVLYAPDIVILDSEHCSVGAMHSDFYYRCNREAIRYILQKFY